MIPIIGEMSRDEFRRAAGMWGIALCVFAAAAGWIFMRFGTAWSVADLPESANMARIVPAYIITEVAMIPLGAKLADYKGCKHLLIFAPAIFIVGSMLCIMSVTVEMLIAFRFVQGIGAGLMLGLAFTSVGRYYERTKRGKCHELMTAAFAIGSLFGTAFGYFLTDNFNWRMGYVVLAVMMLIGSMMAWRLLPHDQGDGIKLDWTNVALVSALFFVAAMYTQTVNVDFDLISVSSGIMVFVIVMLLIVTMRQSRTSANPVIPIGITSFEKKLIFLMFVFSMCGLGLIQYFFKLYLTYYEFDIYKASFMFILLIAGAATPSILGSRMVLKTGVRPWIVIGSIIVTIALITTHFIADQGIVQYGISVFLFGLGLGFIVTQIIISTQSVTKREEMGRHTGNLMAVRMIGILVGNAVVGAYIREVIHGNYVPSVIDVSQTTELLKTVAEHLSADIQYAANSLDEGLMACVLFMAVVTAILAFVAYTLGKDDKGTEDEE